MTTVDILIKPQELIIGIIYLVLGICNFIGALIVRRFDIGRGKIMKYNDIHEKFERNEFLEDFILIYSIMGGIILLFMGVFFIADYSMPTKAHTPKAIDVYRGKTELEITSVNGVPRDTVVVWKNGITE